MKKGISILLVLLLLCSLCGVTAMADDAAELPGSYTLVNMFDPDSEDMSEMIKTLTAFGMRATLTVEEDGSAVMDVFGEELSMVFDFETKTISADGEIIPYSFDGESVLVGDEEQGFLFSRADDEEAAAGSGSEAAEEEPVEVSIEETLLLDRDGIVITAKSIDMDGYFGPELKLLIENKRSEDITVQVRNSSVNGYMIEPMLSVDVAAGKKAIDTLDFMEEDLELAGISVIADIETSFHVFDADSWDTIFDSDPVILETSAAEGFEYRFDDSGDLVYQEHDLEIVVKGLSDLDSWLGPAVLVYLNNTGDRDITVMARNVSVNGFMVDPYFSCDLVAGKRALDTITFPGSELEEKEIEEIEEVELSFCVVDTDSWDTILETAPITLRFD